MEAFWKVKAMKLDIGSFEAGKWEAGGCPLVAAEPLLVIIRWFRMAMNGIMRNLLEFHRLQLLHLILPQLHLHGLKLPIYLLWVLTPAFAAISTIQPPRRKMGQNVPMPRNAFMHTASSI